ncbi:MAG TPA: hypothetical protein VFG68_22950 [Fimbriiglobus sp.]|nr:hypothetical protein [Fimbriiglobus sp.]
MNRPVIFFDLDGVLADFVSGALDCHGAELAIPDVRWDFCSQIGFDGPNDQRFWADLGYDFWRSLDPYPDGFALLRFAEELVGPERIGLLTSPCDTEGCVEGKRAWVAERLPEYRKRLFIGSAKHLFAGPSKVLVDDHDANADAFRAAGGEVYQPARPWNRYRAYCLPDGSFDSLAACDRLERIVERNAVPAAA